MIDIDNWIRELDEEEETAVKDNEEYQRSLFASMFSEKMTICQRGKNCSQGIFQGKT